MTPALRELVHWLAEQVLDDLRRDQPVANDEPCTAKPDDDDAALRDLRPIQH